MAAPVGAAHRLPCAARLGVARRNSLRELCSLRSDSRRESEDEARFARRPRGCAAQRRRHRPGSPHVAAPRRIAPRPTPARPAAACREGNVGGVRSEDGDVRRVNHDTESKGAGRPPPARRVRSREAQQCRPARAARFVPLTRRDCPSAARAASVASFAAGPAPRASQGTPAQRGQAPGAPAAGGLRLCPHQLWHAAPRRPEAADRRQARSGRLRC